MIDVKPLPFEIILNILLYALKDVLITVIGSRFDQNFRLLVQEALLQREPFNRLRFDFQCIYQNPSLQRSSSF